MRILLGVVGAIVFALSPAGAHRIRPLGHVNPGGGFSPSMPFAMTLGCFAMGLTFEEALSAATINGAYSLDRTICYIRAMRTWASLS